MDGWMSTHREKIDGYYQRSIQERIQSEPIQQNSLYSSEPSPSSSSSPTHSCSLPEKALQIPDNFLFSLRIILVLAESSNWRFTCPSLHLIVEIRFVNCDRSAYSYEILVYSKECEGLRDVMVMEKAAETVGKKRKLRLEELEDLPTSSSFQLKTRRLADAKQVNLPSLTCESAGSYGALGSSCSSNGSSDLAKVQEEKDGVTVDQFSVTANGVTSDLRERSETSCEIQVESTARPNESTDPRSRLTGGKKPSDDDLEEFFSSAEKNLQKQFIDKYNYDVVKDEPLEGRFEWVQIKEIQP